MKHSQINSRPYWRTPNSYGAGWCREVRAALADGISRGLRISVSDLPVLSDDQLWQGFRAALKAHKTYADTPAMRNLTIGEHFAIFLGAAFCADNLPTGDCLSEIMESVGADQTNFEAAMAFRVTRAIFDHSASANVGEEHGTILLTKLQLALEELKSRPPLTDVERARNLRYLIETSWA